MVAFTQVLRLRHLAPLVAVLSFAGCNRSSETDKTGPVPGAAAADDPPIPNLHQGAGGSEAEPDSAGPAPVPAVRAAGASGTTERGGAPPPPGASTSGPPPPSAGAADSGAAAGPAADPKTLLQEVRRTSTDDATARSKLAEAEALGASKRALARAALARAKALHREPDRAAAFYTWAVEKDPTYAAPAFELARMAAVRGDVPEVKKWLSETAKRRGGRRLLDQIDFDPTWDIVKDDPEVRALLK